MLMALKLVTLVIVWACHTSPAAAPCEHAFFLLSTVWYSVIRTKFLSYIKAGATQTEMSLLKQYVAGERLDLLEVLSVLRRFQRYGKAQ